MTGPAPKPNATPFEKARARAQRRRPTPAPAPAPAPARFPPSQAALAVWARVRWGADRARRRLHSWADPRRRSLAVVTLILLSLTPLAGPALRGATLASGCLYLAHLERRCPPPYRGRWARWARPAMRQGALAELTSRWYGRSALAPQAGGARRLVRGCLWVTWGLSSWAGLGAPLAPLHLIEDLGNDETRPSQELGFILCLGLGLWAGAGAASGVGVPAGAMGKLAVTGLRWGVTLRVGVALRQALVGAAAASGPLGAPLLLGAVGAVAILLGVRDLRSIRYSPMWALAEAPDPGRMKGGSLGPVGALLFRPLGLMALALAGGVMVGLLAPGPAELSPGLLGALLGGRLG